jgi:hypothetical protein
LEISAGRFDKQSANFSSESIIEILFRNEICRVRPAFNSIDFLEIVSEVLRIVVVELPKVVQAD